MIYVSCMVLKIRGDICQVREKADLKKLLDNS